MLKLNKKNINILILSFLVVLFFSFVNNSQSVVELFDKILGIFSVFIIGGVIAFFLNPILNFFEKKLKLGRKTSIGILYMILLLITIIFILVIIPKFAKNVSDLINILPKYIQSLEAKADIYLDKYKNIIPPFDEELVKNQLDKINNQILKLGQSTLKVVGENIIAWTFSFFEIIAAFIFSIFFLGQKEYFSEFSEEIVTVFFGEEKNKKLSFWIDKVKKNFLEYLHGKTLDCFIIGALAFIFLSFMKIPYSVFLWLFITITNFIPYFGPFLGMCLAVIITLFSFPQNALVVFGFLLALQQFDAWFLEPRILGDKLKLKMFWTVAAVTIGGKLAGVLGIILSAPIAGLIKECYEIYKDNKKLKK
jgi:predicted PurR-regulated permease PerM